MCSLFLKQFQIAVSKGANAKADVTFLLMLGFFCVKLSGFRSAC